VYAATGQYVATLTVTDEGGATAVDQVDVTVIPAPSSSNPVGTVPDRELSTEQPLRLGLELDGSLSLTWGDSCRVSDRDFAVYQGPLGAFSQQTPVVCSTGNQTGTTLVPDSGNTFYLIIAHDGAYEGSYGSDSFGNQRVAGPVQCRPTAAAQSCP